MALRRICCDSRLALKTSRISGTTSCRRWSDERPGRRNQPAGGVGRVRTQAPPGGMQVKFVELIDDVGKCIDVAGVLVIVLGGIAATIKAVVEIYGREPDTYRKFRRQFGRSILLGLELLVAADIIRTV